MYDKSTDPVETIRQMIQSGQIQKGNRLPPERVLAGTLGMSRSALRKALAELESEGLIWRHVGRGTFVGSVPEPSEINIRPLMELTSPFEIMEVRLVIEPKMAAMAAMRANSKEIDKMEVAVHRSETAAGFEDNEKWDLVLHETIAQATNNLLLRSLFNIANQLRKGQVWGRMKEASLTPERWKIYANQHHKLVAAIRDRNAALAETVMLDHLQTVLRNMQNES